MKKIYYLLLIAFVSISSLSLFSCGGDDEEEFVNEPVISAITKTELESVASFTYRDYEDNVLYIKFRDGRLYTKEVTKYGNVCNEDVMSYTLTGDKIDITFETNFSFPGIGDADNITKSSLFKVTCLCEPAAILESPAIVSP